MWDIEDNRTPPETYFYVPECIDSFHGREDKIKELDTLFFKENKTKIVIHGLPGVGKSELSKQFANHCKRENKVERTFWIEAEHIFKDLLHYELNDKYKDVRCLYIFDNAVSRSSIFEYESKNEKHLTLVTSVEGNWDDFVPVQLDSLPLKEAVQLLKEISNCGDELKNESFEDLAKAVSCAPLGLQVVGGFVREEKKCLEHSFMLEDYVNKIKEYQFDVLHESAGNTYKKTIYKTMALSVDKIRDMNDNRAELALNILYFCAFLDPDSTYVSQFLQFSIVQELVQHFNSDSDNSTNSISDNDSNSNSDSDSAICTNSISDSNSNSDSDIDNCSNSISDRNSNRDSDSDNCTNSISNSNSNSDSKTRSSTNKLYLTYYGDDSKIIVLKHALGLLINFSFVTYASQYEYIITFHRLTQSFLKDYLESRNLIEEYLTDCLHTAFLHSSFFFQRVVLRSCEEYSDVVHNFFKTQNSKNIQILILKNLVQYGCVDCLKKIFHCLTENLIEFAFFCISQDIPMLENNQILILECLLEYININSTNEAGDSVLHIVAKTGNIESIKFLIERGANVNAKNNAGETPLFLLPRYLIYTANEDWDSMLKMFEFNKGLTNNNKETLLHVAAVNLESTLVEKLILNHGMDISQTDLTNRTPIDSLFTKTKGIFAHKKLYLTFKVLNKHGAKLNVKLADKKVTFYILYSVIRHDDVELLECALQQGCDVHCESESERNRTLLHIAAEFGNLTTIKFLINKGLNINSVDSGNETAAFYFVRYVAVGKISNMSLVEQTLDLLNCQEQTQITDTYYGDSMLHRAANYAHKDLVQLLIERYKFNVNQQNNRYGYTPLHKVINNSLWLDKKNVTDVVKILIQAGADLNIVSKYHGTPLQLAHELVEFDFGPEVEFLIPLLTRRKSCNVL